MLGRQPSERILDLVLRQGAAAEQGKEVFFLVDDVQGQVVTDEVEDARDRLGGEGARRGDLLHQAAKLAMPVVLGEEPFERLAQQLAWNLLDVGKGGARHGGSPEAQ